MKTDKPEMVKTSEGVPASPGDTKKYAAPFYEVTEDEHGFLLTLEMPGVSKETLEIKADRESLTVRGWRGESTEGLKPLLRERPSAEFLREFSMDDTVDWEKITAAVRDGVVTVTIPKASHAKPHTIKIT